MFDFTNISFWLYFIFFWISIFFAFFIPGDVALRKINLSLFQRIVLGVIVGMVLWAWQGFIFGYLELRFLTFVYLITFFIFWILNLKKSSINSFKLSFFSKNYFLWILIIIGVVFQLSTVWFNGTLNAQGLFFCCGDPTDNIFHIALTNQIIKNIPPFEPGMSDLVVKNYHYWGNLVVAELIRVFKLPLIAVQFQYSTLLVSLFLGLSAVVFGQIENLGKKFTAWLLFFLYFGGDLIFLVVSFMRRELNFNMSSIEDGAKFLVNPPRAFSIIIFFAGISLFSYWMKKKDLYSGLLTALILGSLIGFKVYTGIFALSGLSILAGYFLKKREFNRLFIICISIILSLIIYLPTNVKAGGFYFTRFALFENFIVQPWMMLDRLELARRIYLASNNWLRVFEYEAIYFFIFIFSVFGTKLIFLLQAKKSIGFLRRELNIFLFGGVVVSLILGLFFQQDSGGANTFNFLVSVFIIISIYSAIACTYLLKTGNRIIFFAMIILIMLTVPRVFHQVYSNSNNILKKSGFLVTNDELNASNYLRRETNNKSLILVDDRALDSERSLYISFLADRPMFLSGKGLLASHGQKTSKKNAIKRQILESNNGFEVAQKLVENKIDYLYLGYPYSITTSDYLKFTKKVYEGNKITILQVLKPEIYLYLKNGFNNK